jgi:hypothetical protein
MITRDNNHIYRDDGGEPYISVTQHLQIAGLVDYSMCRTEDLIYAAERGKYVHEAINMYLYDDLDVEGLDESYRGYVQAAIKFLESITVLSSEEIVCDPDLRTAGQYDLIGRCDLMKTLVEFKTCSTLPSTTSLQLSGYKHLDYVYGNRDEPIMRRMAVLLKNNGSYTVHEFKDKNEPWFVRIARNNWAALNAGIIPLGAKASDETYNLCREIIGK